MKRMALSSILALIFTFFHANAQNCEVLNQYVDSIYTNEEIHTLEKRVCKLLKKQKAVPNDNKVNIYYIPDYDIPDYCIMPPDSIQEYYLLGKQGVRVDKKDFLTGGFLRKLFRQEMTSRNKICGTTYISANVIVTNSSDNLIASGDAHCLYITAHYNKDFYDNDCFILKKMRELKLKHLFTLHKIWMLPTFGVTEKDEIIVFLYDRGHKVYTIEKFVDIYSKSEFYGKVFSN